MFMTTMNTTLTSLDMRNNSVVTAAGITSLVALFPGLRTLNLASCTALEVFPLALAVLPELRTLNMSFCDVVVDAPVDWDAQAQLSLQELDLRYNRRLHDGDLVVLAAMFPAVARLDLRQCAGLSHFPLAVFDFQDLATLSLQGCGLQLRVPSTIACLPLHAGLNTVTLAHNPRLTDGQLELLLAATPLLVNLDVSHCRGLTTLPLGVLFHTPSLQSLVLADAHLGIVVPVAFVAATNTSLTHLDLHNNPDVTAEGLDAAAVLFPHIQCLDVRGCPLVATSPPLGRDAAAGPHLSTWRSDAVPRTREQPHMVPAWSSAVTGAVDPGDDPAFVDTSSSDADDDSSSDSVHGSDDDVDMPPSPVHGALSPTGAALAPPTTAMVASGSTMGVALSVAEADAAVAAIVTGGMPVSATDGTAGAAGAAVGAGAGTATCAGSSSSSTIDVATAGGVHAGGATQPQGRLQRAEAQRRARQRAASVAAEARAQKALLLAQHEQAKAAAELAQQRQHARKFRRWKKMARVTQGVAAFVSNAADAAAAAASPARFEARRSRSKQLRVVGKATQSPARAGTAASTAMVLHPPQQLDAVMTLQPRSTVARSGSRASALALPKVRAAATTTTTTTVATPGGGLALHASASARRMRARSEASKQGEVGGTSFTLNSSMPARLSASQVRSASALPVLGVSRDRPRLTRQTPRAMPPKVHATSNAVAVVAGTESGALAAPTVSPASSRWRRLKVTASQRWESLKGVGSSAKEVARMLAGQPAPETVVGSDTIGQPGKIGDAPADGCVAAVWGSNVIYITRRVGSTLLLGHRW